ncbi:Predicted arabinose efflux permease, MFS family [Amycolatopsis xylanica]|uniref:Predicted arabinose efflux permease, MFS family n=1 Tax=Amycolatopsis xylanica TaxID=589385 RepID=A0A1H3HMK7_9PSEU|nr:MFS transporter [Amycolatopsis xylanica]SDY16766.1 Predicted arabinose efflux permease, MFS family [Amycolatopsis xylanica]
MTGDLRQARWAVSTVFAVCGAAFATWLARVPAVQAQLGLSTGQLAVGLFGLAMGSVVALLGAGALITKVGSRGGVLIGAVVLCGGLPLVAFAPSLPVFVAALVVLGVGNSVLDVSMNAHAARVEEGYGRPIFAGFHAFWNIGGLAGSGVDALMEAWHVPVTVHFSVAGAVLLAVVLWAALTRFLTGADRGQGEAAFALPSRALIPLGVIAFCGFVAEGAVNSWSAVYLTDVTGAVPALASLGYFAFSITMIAVRLVADRLVMRFGTVRFIQAVTVVAVLGFALVLLAASPIVTIIGFAVVGLGVAGIVPIAWSVASKKQPDSPGQAVAAVAACGYLGFLVEPVIVGALANGIGLHWALGSAVVLTACVFFLAPAMRVREPVLSGGHDGNRP